MGIPNLKIVEKSFIARIAAKVRKSDSIAIVLGQKIYLFGANREQFLANRRWVEHEMVHLEQFRRYGTIRFIILYLWESIKKGYWNNKFETEARNSSTKI